MTNLPGRSASILALLALIVLTACGEFGSPLDPQDDQPGEFTLVTSTAGNGSGTITSDPAGIDCGNDCSATFSPGGDITLTAEPQSGSVFAGWTAACEGQGATCRLTMSTNYTAIAAFEPAEQGDDPTGEDGQAGDDDPTGDDGPAADAPYAEQMTKESGVRDGEFSPGFGARVDVSGEYAVVGAPGGDGVEGDGVFFFERDGETWVEAGRYDIPEEITSATTGWAIAISGTYAAANYLCDLEHPACEGNGFLVFERQGGEWVRVERFAAEERGPDFGQSLAFSGDYLFAGAAEDEFGVDGLVNVYRRVDGTWELQQTISEVDEDGERFGDEVAANAEYLAVGSNRGAHVYRLGAGRWEYLQTVDIPSGEDFRDVAMSDRWLTSSWADTKVYELRDGQWELTGEMVGPGEAAPAGNYLLLGFPADDTQGPDAGSVRIFKWTGAKWEQVSELFASDPDPGASFGASVAATTDYAVVGADAGFGDDTTVGAAYFFRNRATN